MARKQMCISVSEELYEEIISIKKETGLTFSQICELKMRGYEVKKR